MCHINFYTMRAINPYAKGLPQQYAPVEERNGDIVKRKDTTTFQYAPPDNPNWSGEKFNAESRYAGDEYFYTVNKQGFRADTFDKNNPGLMSLGCSHTYGIGIPQDKVWPHLLSDKLNLPNWNLGCGGMGADYCYYIAKQFFEEGYFPKLVAVLWPDVHRTLIRADDFNIDESINQYILSEQTKINQTVVNYCPGNEEGIADRQYDKPDFSQGLKSLLLRSNADVISSFLIFRDSLILLCKAYNIEYVEILPKWSEDRILKFTKTCPYNVPTGTVWNDPKIPWGEEKARDGSHHGENIQENISEKFHDLYTNHKYK